MVAAILFSHIDSCSRVYNAQIQTDRHMNQLIYRIRDVTNSSCYLYGNEFLERGGCLGEIYVSKNTADDVWPYLRHCVREQYIYTMATTVSGANNLNQNNLP